MSLPLRGVGPSGDGGPPILVFHDDFSADTSANYDVGGTGSIVIAGGHLEIAPTPTRPYVSPKNVFVPGDVVVVTKLHIATPGAGTTGDLAFGIALNTDWPWNVDNGEAYIEGNSSLGGDPHLNLNVLVPPAWQSQYGPSDLSRGDLWFVTRREGTTVKGEYWATDPQQGGSPTEADVVSGVALLDPPSPSTYKRVTMDIRGDNNVAAGLSYVDELWVYSGSGALG